jgi:hypothetical protein
MAKKQDGTDDGLGEEVIQFVSMMRDTEEWPAPHTAEVHPDEAKNYYSGGWVPAKEAE